MKCLYLNFTIPMNELYIKTDVKVDMEIDNFFLEDDNSTQTHNQTQKYTHT